MRVLGREHQMESTRCSAYINGGEGTHQNYPFIGVRHTSSLFSMQTIPCRIEKLVENPDWHMEKFAEFSRQKMAARGWPGFTRSTTPIFMYAISNMRNSNVHPIRLPTIIVATAVGKAKRSRGGGLQWARWSKIRPLANYHLTLLQQGRDRKEDRYRRQNRQRFQAINCRKKKQNAARLHSMMRMGRFARRIKNFVNTSVLSRGLGACQDLREARRGEETATPRPSGPDWNRMPQEFVFAATTRSRNIGKFQNLRAAVGGREDSVATSIYSSPRPIAKHPTGAVR